MAQKNFSVPYIDRPGDSLAKDIALLWDKWNSQRRSQIEKWKEIRNYIFASDTSTTTNRTLPWKNSTTLPKLCQIRDNLHSNYISALFPNEDWFIWEGGDRDSVSRDKRTIIEAYMKDKIKQSGFEIEISKLLLDFIDTGNAFCTAVYENNIRTDDQGQQIINYTGCKAVRISPYDIVFNPMASTFDEAPKIVRSMYSMGELLSLADDNPEYSYLSRVLKHREELKQKRDRGMRYEDWDKGQGFLMDGFGNFEEYLSSDMVELLEFYGDIYDQKAKKLYKGRLITIADRSWVLNDRALDTYQGYTPIFHVGWRIRSDNLWGMSPLENLVGMQYRIDHLENLKADAMDLAIFPPLVVQGEVEEFKYGPGEIIHVDTDGAILELGKNLGAVISTDNEIAFLQAQMEEFAGAPKEAMGIRTPGEKTMYEVQQLQNAAGRIFQEKITRFEKAIIDKLLNYMFILSVANIGEAESIRYRDPTYGATMFAQVEKEDIDAIGKFRPIGARHFASQSQLLNNITQLQQSGLGQLIAPHLSSIRFAELVEDILGVRKYSLVEPYVQIEEAAEAQKQQILYQEQVAMDTGSDPVQNELMGREALRASEQAQRQGASEVDMMNAMAMGGGGEAELANPGPEGM